MMFEETKIDCDKFLRTVDPVAHIDFEGARFTPGLLVFQNAFEGKTFSDIIAIQNVSRRSLSVLISKPSSNALKVRYMANEKYVCPGLKVFCKVTYKFTKHMAVPQIILPIHVNDNPFYFKVNIVLSKAEIMVSPDILDFGCFDANHTPMLRRFSIHNMGAQNTRFAIDLGRNDLDLVVEPMRGTVEAGRSTKITIEIMGSSECDFDTEFWIKCEQPQRVRIRGNFIRPKLHTNHPETCGDFTLIDFPQIYFGCRSVRTLLIENFSSSPCMFCTVAETNKTEILYQIARSTENRFKSIDIQPHESRMLPHQKQVIQFTFNPIKESKISDTEYYVGFIKICKLNFRDMSHFEGNATTPTTTEMSIRSSVILSMSFSEDTFFPVHPLSQELTADISAASYLRICFHGEAQSAKVLVKPEIIDMKRMVVNDKQRHHVYIQNNSEVLPLLVRYRKTAYIELTPKEFNLKPSGTVETTATFLMSHVASQEKITVKSGDSVITTADIRVKGYIKNTRTIQTKITLELYGQNQPEVLNEYVLVGEHHIPCRLTANFHPDASKNALKPRFNMGITPMIINEVGYLTEKLAFNTEVEIPEMAIASMNKSKLRKYGDQLIALPNDRPKCLRPWTNAMGCRTIFAKLPRIVSNDEYMLNEKELSKRGKEKLYYDNYIKSLYWKERKKMSFGTALYQTTDSRLRMLEDVSFPDIVQRKLTDSANGIIKFIPLTPSELRNVDIKPVRIFLGRVAPSTGVVETFHIKNDNNFAIHIQMISLKMGITFIEVDDYVVEGNSEREIVFVYNATCVGRYTVPVEIVINKTHVFEINVVAYVVSKVVQCDNREWVILSTDRSTEFLELRNPLNSHVSFTWETTSPCFTIHPSEGCIPPNRTILCHAMYKQVARQSDFTEILLISESGYTEYIKIIYKKQLVQVATDVKQLRIDTIPLNIPIQRYITLRNFSSEAASFTVVTPNPIWGVELSPVDGVISARADQIITVKIHIKVPITFSCILSINIERCGGVDIEFTGTVVFPKVTIDQHYITMKKIVPFAEEKFACKIKNISILPVYITFAIENFPEFTMCENKSEKSITCHDKLVLNPTESKTIIFYFRPTEAAVYGLFLPIVINGLIGPPQLNARKSTTPSCYIIDEFRKYEHISYVKQMEIPKTLSLCKITTTVSKPTLAFSRFKLNFIYHHEKSYALVTSSEFKVTNVSSNKMEICIRLDDLKKPFGFVYLAGKEVESYERSYLICLEAGETSSFDATFLPENMAFGNYTANLPIYVHGFYDGCVFNTITLHGIYPRPSIVATQEVIYLEPTGLKYISRYTTKLKISHHYGNCLIMAEAHKKDMTFEFEGGRRLKHGSYKLGVTINLQLLKARALDCRSRFSCTCGATCDIRIVGCFESCIPTAHSCFHWYGHIGIAEASESEEGDRIVKHSESLELTMDSTLSIMSGYNVSSVVTNETIYPLFPLPDDVSDYARYMREVCTVAEKWLYTQGFNCSKFYHIPEDLAVYPIEIETKREGRLRKTEKLPAFAQLLINLAGKEVRKFIFVSFSGKDTEKAKMIYMHTYNRNCLEFLKAQGAFLPHVSPEMLLTYDHYVLHEHSTIKETERKNELDPTEFWQLSTQCWLDIILQTYKVFMLLRIDSVKNPHVDMKEKDKPSEKEVLSTASSSLASRMESHSNLSTIGKSSKSLLKTVYSKTFSSVLEKAAYDDTIYTKSEAILLQWLEFHFERNRATLWNPERYGQHIFKLTKRKVRLFEVDLRDGLVLGAVMASYCPYLRSHVQNMYVSPAKPEQIYHNAGKIVQAWHWLKLSFDITPETIVYPNILEMLMVVNYMFIVFPSLYPSETVTITCCFTEVTEHEVAIENDSDATILYNILFFGKDKQYFEAATQVLVVPSKQSSSLKIKFFAKSMVKVSAVLVLAGEYPGRKYAKCLAMNLVGIPDITVANFELSIVKNLYEVSVTDIEIESPYKVEARYDAVITADPFAQNVTFNKWMPKMEFSLPGRFYSRQNTYQFNSEGKCSIQVNVCCGSPYPHSYWIYFLNQEIGDFALKITITGKLSKKNSEKLIVHLPRGFATSKCSCRGDSGKFLTFCPRTITVDIPRKNNILWESVKNMLTACVSEEKYAFFKKYLAIPTGRRVLRLIAECDPDHNSEMDYVFRKSAEFRIKHRNPGIKSAKSIVIDDMIGDKSSPLLFHIDEGKNVEKVFMKLEEVTGNETRFYNVIFQDNECLQESEDDLNSTE